jgi:hypothetical protein
MDAYIKARLCRRWPGCGNHPAGGAGVLVKGHPLRDLKLAAQDSAAPKGAPASRVRLYAFYWLFDAYSW